MRQLLLLLTLYSCIGCHDDCACNYKFVHMMSHELDSLRVLEHASTADREIHVPINNNYHYNIEDKKLIYSWLNTLSSELIDNITNQQKVIKKTYYIKNEITERYDQILAYDRTLEDDWYTKMSHPQGTPSIIFSTRIVVSDIILSKEEEILIIEIEDYQCVYRN